jgi:cysteine desulfuration protein SufE
MTINEKQDQIIEDFAMFEDWMDIQLGKDLPEMDSSYKTDDNLIKGCQSRVWLHPIFKDGQLCFDADSDALITKGLVSMVVQVLSCHTPKEIADAEIYFVDKIGLTSHLSPTRSNGLLSMLKQMKMYAIAFQSKVLQ